MIRFSVQILLAVLTSVLSSHICHAQDLPDKGAWDFSVWAAGATGAETTNSWFQSQNWMAGLSTSKFISGDISYGWLRNRMEYGWDLIPVFESRNNQNVHGFAFDPIVFRWNAKIHTARFAPYMEGSGGLLYTLAKLPPGNTARFNVMATGGLGLHIFVNHRPSWDVSVRWMHLSNANMGPFNPQFNGVQLRLGYHWFRSRSFGDHD